MGSGLDHNYQLTHLPVASTGAEGMPSYRLATQVVDGQDEYLLTRCFQKEHQRRQCLASSAWE
jgi:hypothetical protein